MVLFTGGKTGGHIVPLINLIANSKEKCMYVGYEGYLEEKLCMSNDIEFIGLPKYNNKYYRIIKGFFFLNKKLKKLNIKAVVSSGGFVSTPLILYAIIHKIPFYLLEENLIIGRFNEFFSKFSKNIFLAHPLPKMKKKYIYTGIPMKSINIKPYKSYDVVVIGGSLGSKPLCDAAVNISKKYNTLLIAGRYADDYRGMGLDILEFSSDLYSIISNSKCIISRAGAMTTYEAMYLNKPLIVIPSESTKRNHQVINAEYFESKGIAIMVKENDIENNLIDKIDKLLSNPNERIAMTFKQREYIIKNSNERIWQIINEL